MKANYIIKDKKKHHDIMDKHSSEQFAIAVYKCWSHTFSAIRSNGRQAGRQAAFNKVTALLQQYE